MRLFKSNDQISVHAIAGTYVVLLGLDATEAARKRLLGFQIVREDSQGRTKPLKGPKVFKDISNDVSLVQAFLWGDYAAQPGNQYTYQITPVYGAPDALVLGDELSVSVTTEQLDDQVHGVFFNRGVAGSQAYARRFEDHRRSYRVEENLWKSFIKPEDVPDRKAYQWLSRGLEEGMIAFIQQAEDAQYTIRASVYEFSYLPIIREFASALERGVDVKIVHHSKPKTTYALKRDWDANVIVESDSTRDQPKEDDIVYKNKTVVKKVGPDEVGAATEKAVRNAGIRNQTGHDRYKLERAFDEMLIKRTHPSISHNKFIVLLKDDKPVQVWTGSTNFTDGGIFGQSNVGHVIRDEATAAAYYAYWEQLSIDPESEKLRQWTVQKGVALAGADPVPLHAITPIFSPRANEDVLDWYAAQIGRAVHSVHLTSAFTISDPFLERLTDNAPADEDPETPYLRYVLLEGITGLLREKSKLVRAVPLNCVAWGDTLRTRHEEDELVESLTGLNNHVNYLHTKYMLIDPLTDDPIVVTGSANFSAASTTKNDENMIVIRGNKRVADIFIGEFMRLFNHYRTRNMLNALDDADFEPGRYLAEDDSWTLPYFDQGSELYQERLLFCQPPPPKPVLDLKYYMLDWDDNILFMPTKIHLIKDGEPVELSTKEYAEVRKDNTYSFPEGDANEAFAEFRDESGDFVGDLQKAIQAQAFAPSYRAFKRALCEARLFAIVTARGHSEETLRKGVEVFIQEALTDEERTEMLTNIQRYNKMVGISVTDEVGLSRYLDLNGYIGVSSPEFLKAYRSVRSDKVDSDKATGADNPEATKTYAVQKFIEKTVALADHLPASSRKIAFGFSDDDLGNLNAMRTFIENKLSEEFHTVQFFVYSTSETAVRVEAL